MLLLIINNNININIILLYVIYTIILERVINIYSFITTIIY